MIRYLLCAALALSATQQFTDMNIETEGNPNTDAGELDTGNNDLYSNRPHSDVGPYSDTPPGDIDLYSNRPPNTFFESLGVFKYVGSPLVLFLVWGLRRSLRREEKAIKDSGMTEQDLRENTIPSQYASKFTEIWIAGWILPAIVLFGNIAIQIYYFWGDTMSPMGLWGLDVVVSLFVMVCGLVALRWEKRMPTYQEFEQARINEMELTIAKRSEKETPR